MDEEYARQVCTLMGWDPVNIKVPHPAPDPATGQQPANNPGYCFLTFPSHAHAAAVLAQINNAGKSVTMPNSSRPFVLNWASSVPASATGASASFSGGAYPSSAPQQPQYQKEYSIFVGDLAPETSNSDLVAVFRNPVLGLRNDREPKYIRPFLSCKSAKIMLDPVTGVSRGYGFVRFTDEADQQRALIEMHGLYCLSRPMRISPATAKHKNPPAPAPPLSISPFDVSPTGLHLQDPKNQALTVALPLPPQTNSVSAPIAATTSNLSINSNGASTSGSSIGGSHSSNSISSNSNSSLTSAFGSATSSEDALSLQHNALAQLAKQYAGGDLATGSVNSSFANDPQLRQVLQAQQNDPAPRFMVHEDHWKHQAQARAILGNLIGPNGEQLTSTDPYNTTVFVGGLSPLISEETLRTFFAPFGDIHYVKVPVGKHCGFVQFVRKADAERAIEKMQGFPIGGSKIRLSWGRSQYKAAQAAAQAAQAALQQQYPGGQVGTLTQEQALSLLQKFAMQNYRPEQPLPAGNPVQLPEAGVSDHSGINYATMVANGGISLGMPRDDTGGSTDSYTAYSLPRPEVHRTLSNFSPFSPDPALSVPETQSRRDSAYLNFLGQSQELKTGTSPTGLGNGSKVSPTSSRPSSAVRYGRTEGSISRPPSGPAIGDGRPEYDPMQDLNNTLASLEIDRPWKSNEGGQPSSAHSGQFHLSTGSSP
ncbi:RNA-binding protein Csx1 [Coprinopsis cinerea AmutBmut pab1-1]|nr:RNA-binding protein Csx1 [Coprinopsis cinerea AmutBmut pab1-1]